MSTLVRVAVLGVGSLGKEHARIFAELSRLGVCQFTGIYDLNAELAKAHALKHGVRAFGSVAEAAGGADALTIVTPTVTHVALARELLAAGRHLLIEKPMADNSAEASELVELAGRRGVILQVGHVERFNPVVSYLEQAARHPRFIECHRL
ncbi:MAG: Gfo/Idh/MocA family oxidoreductase, partial [Verrucomicrobiae bacterium]|nr:Gfo/Idh/MocA family oxidoreductase [Verrucomicrobiae bacterium]